MNIDSFLNLISNIISALLVILGILVFVAKKWISEKITIYFQKKLLNDIENYKHNLIKELEYYKSGLIKDVELYKLDLDNRKKITDRIMDKRFEAYELIAKSYISLINDISGHIATNKPSDNKDEIEYKYRMLNQLKEIDGKIDKFSLYLSLKIIEKIIELKSNLLDLISADKMYDKKEFEQSMFIYAELSTILRNDLLIEENILLEKQNT